MKKKMSIDGWTAFNKILEKTYYSFMGLRVCTTSRRRECEKKGLCEECVPPGTLFRRKLMVKLGLKGAKFNGFDYQLTPEQEKAGEELVMKYLLSCLNKCKPVKIMISPRKRP